MLDTLKQGLKHRDPRTAVLIRIRIKVGSEWSDAVIHNVSRRGVLIAADTAPETGSYLEARRWSHIIIGRVMWHKGRFFGVRAQDNIDLADLQRPPQHIRSGSMTGKTSEGIERRSERRNTRDAGIARRLERNRELSRVFEFVTIALAGVALCIVIATSVYDVLRAPISCIENAMAKQP